MAWILYGRPSTSAGPTMRKLSKQETASAAAAQVHCGERIARPAGARTAAGRKRSL